MNKIKEILRRLVQNKKLLWTVIGGACLLVAAVVLTVVLTGGEKPAPGGDPGATGNTGYALTLKTEGGMVLSNVEVFVYADSALEDMFAVGKTDESGAYSFEGAASGTYYAVLKGVPAGYVCEESYLMTADTQIVLEVELLDGAELTDLSLGLGDVMFDFTVTDSDGNVHTLSELLETKKAVVLNFWYTQCGPCKAEFPFLQEAYDRYSDQIALLALDPYAADDEAAVARFKSDMALTVPMAKVDAVWEAVFGLQAYPTTVVIDRYGTVSMIHGGSVDNTQTFADVFAFYTADAYVQQKVSSIYELPVTEAEEGTAENPYEFGGIMEFEVEVDTGATVYCDVYKVSGMQLTVNGEAVSILYNEQTYQPVGGVITFGVETPDTYTPVKLAITNSGSAKKTVKVVFSFLPGTMSNPHSLEMGNFTVSVEAGNDQGVYYSYIAAEAGTVTVKCTGATEGVAYTFTLYNLTSYAYRTLDADGQDNTLTIRVSAGDELQFSAGTLPNGDNEYPAGTLSFTASFEKGEAPAEPTNAPTEAPTEKPTEKPAQQSTQKPTESSSGSGGTNEVRIMEPSGTFEAPSLKNGKWTTHDYYAVAEGTFSAEMKQNTMTYFIFTPVRSGVYKISASGSTTVVLGAYGGPAYPLTSSTVDASSGYFEMEVLRNNIGDGVTRETTQYVIGIYAADKSAGTCTLTVQWLKEAKLTAADLEAEAVEPDPRYLVSCTASGSFVDFDVTNASAVITQEGGYWYCNGKQLYIRLTKPSSYLDSLATVAENTGLTVVTYNSAGEPVRKVQYKTMVDAYSAYCNSDGVVPLNDELAAMLKVVGGDKGWWDSTSQNYRFTGVDLVRENAWLFACGYYG